MKRSRHIWVAFTACLAVVLAAMGWISWKALRLEQAEMEARGQAEEARRQAALEQEVRLALWQMDTTVAPLVAQESARPYFTYSTFLPIDRAYRQMFNEDPGPERLVPSPLLKDVPPQILVHFQFEPDGRLTSPRVPSERDYTLAVPDYITQEEVTEAHAQLDRLAGMVNRKELLALLPESIAEPLPVVIAPWAKLPDPELAQAQFRADAQRRGRGYAEFNLRSRAVTNSANAILQTQRMNYFANFALESSDIGGVLMTPFWVDGNLILARRVSAGGRQYVQGCLLDWPAIKASLLAAVKDVLPDADLEPLTERSAEDESRRLAALPVRLVPGKRLGHETIAEHVLPAGPIGEMTPAQPDGLLSPIQLSLLVAWGCIVLGAVAVAVLLSGVMRLSERRAAFVSAVTHELRTPLTTFHMYSEMLAEGMVPDQEQQNYLTTLRSEAARLSHLVENVLCYARLERGRSDGRIEDLSLDGLLGEIEHRLADRARRDGMELVVEGDDAVRRTIVRANPSAVEQILFNLVDNAGKYAAGASDKQIHLCVRRIDGTVELRVRDHGPGISGPAARRLFHSFSKSAQDAANSAPGVGLGLALSHRLARDMGARLWLDKTVSDGACLVLALPVSDKSAPC